jgi:mRNA-degrading endonuclease RelE of RelBE toxin-antitoxin system
MVLYTESTEQARAPSSPVKMKFEIAFTPTAAEHVRELRKYDQRIILDAVDEQLAQDPITETRNRKRLGENELSDWELRVQDYRVFYDVLIDDERRIVKVKAVGRKEHGVLRVGEKEVQL